MFHYFSWPRCSRVKKKGAENDSEDLEVDWEGDHVAFAIGELGLRLHDFYDMPWCEYLIKSYSYRRNLENIEEREWQKTKFIAWHVLAASMSIDQKKLPSLERFVTGKSKSINKASGAVKSAFIAEYEEYLSKINQNKDK